MTVVRGFWPTLRFCWRAIFLPVWVKPERRKGRKG